MTPAAHRVRGFTLIEVMIVVAIVAILAALSYPSYLEVIRKSWRSEARSALVQQMQQQERYFTAEGRYRAYKGDSGDAGAGGKYTVESGPCDGRATLDSCIRLTATLKPGLSDPRGGAIWIDSSGDKGCEGAQHVGCWQ